MAREGSIWLEARGFSMYPLIRNGDSLGIKPISFRELKVGDAVITKGKYQGSTVTAHRLIKKLEDQNLLLTKGDNDGSRNYDSPVRVEHLIGKVIAVRRGKDIIKMDNALWSMINSVIAKLNSKAPELAKVFLLTVSLFSIPRLIFPKISRAVIGR